MFFCERCNPGIKKCIKGNNVGTLFVEDSISFFIYRMKSLRQNVQMSQQITFLNRKPAAAAGN